MWRPALAVVRPLVAVLAAFAVVAVTVAAVPSDATQPARIVEHAQFGIEHGRAFGGGLDDGWS